MFTFKMLHSPTGQAYFYFQNIILSHGTSIFLLSKCYTLPRCKRIFTFKKLYSPMVQAYFYFQKVILSHGTSVFLLSKIILSHGTSVFLLSKYYTLPRYKRIFTFKMPYSPTVQAYFYFQNVILFHGTSANVISFIFLREAWPTLRRLSRKS